MKKCIALLVVSVLLTSLAAGCGTKVEPQMEKEEEKIVWASNISSNKTEVVSSSMTMDGFDEKLLNYLAQRTEGNYMASPLSFRYALGLLMAGAEGETEAELLKAFGVSSVEEFNRYCLDFNGFVEFFADNLDREIKEHNEFKEKGWLPEDTKEPFRALRVANSVWKADRIEASFNEAYRKAVEENYAAEYCSFNESNAVARINDWADRKTEHMISQLLPDSYPTENLAVVLMNALYFKDAWQVEFEKAFTREDDFHAEGGKTTRKDFMNLSKRFSYYEDKDTQLVILPMKGGVNMAFVIGSTDGLAKKISSAGSVEVNVTIPKMDLETDFSNGEFVDFLKKNGVKRAFDSEGADFSGMIDHSVFVSDIIQKTRIKLDESGVEAAAVTAIMTLESVNIRPEEPKTFTADRPFSFYIYTTCNDTTAIMFAGEIVE